MQDLTEYDQQYANHFIDTLSATGPEGHRLYAILDGAQDSRIYRHLQQHGDVYMSMYTDDVAEPLKAVGPLLYQFRKNDELTAWLIKHGAFNNWFIVFPSLGKTMVQLRRHFKRFAVVLSPQGKRMYFRYYDPRVLGGFLVAADDCQLSIIFGDIGCMWASGSELGQYCKFVKCTSRSESIELVDLSYRENFTITPDDAPVTVSPTETA
ncbi:Uncharacterised protein [BD1-7 clade bacterium]|nr:Uncharacterised protein [BD1-7 clade bacterium]